MRVEGLLLIPRDAPALRKNNPVLAHNIVWSLRKGLFEVGNAALLALELLPQNNFENVSKLSIGEGVTGRVHHRVAKAWV